MWFEKMELEKLDDSDESDSGLTLDVPVDTSIEIDDTQPRQCPKCEGNPTMRQHFVGGEGEGVRIDTCGSCEATWLDHGELEWIQSH